MVSECCEPLRPSCPCEEDVMRFVEHIRTPIARLHNVHSPTHFVHHGNQQTSRGVDNDASLPVTELILQA